jgi:transposase
MTNVTPTSHTVLRTPSLKARAGRRLSDATATFWSTRWRDCLPPPADADLRAARMSRDLARFDALRDDVAFVEDQIEQLLADSAGQILTSLPGVSTVRAAAFAAYTLPIERFATPEQLYSATGLAPASYQSSTVRRRGTISRTGLPEHRDALIGIAWGLANSRPPSSSDWTSWSPAARRHWTRESRSPATPAGSAGECFTPNSPTTIGVTIAPGETAGGDGV